MAETKKIIRQSLANLSSLANQQSGVRSVVDADLGFKMWGGKDDGGSVVYFLAKDKPGQLTTLTLTDATIATGSNGIVWHDATGVLAGDAVINTLSDVNIAGIANNDILQYNSTSGKWENETLAAPLTYKGTWNANTNTPTLGSSGTGGVQNDYYIVSVAGTTTIDGESDWQVGDWIVHNGATWSKIDNTQSTTPTITDFTNATHDHTSAAAGGTLGITDITAGNWKLFYSNGSGVITELALDTVGKVLTAGGAAAAPTWETPSAGGDMDDVYNAGSAIAVDNTDVAWTYTGAKSTTHDLAGCTGTSDGFQIVDGADYFALYHRGADDLDLSAQLGTVTLTTAGLMDINAGANLDVDVTGNITIDSTVDTTLTAGGALHLITPTIADFTNATHDHDGTSGGGQIELDDIYNNSAGASTVTVDAGDLTWFLHTTSDFIIDLSNINVSRGPGFHVNNGTDHISMFWEGLNDSDLDIQMHSVDLACSVLDIDSTSSMTIDSDADISIDAVTTIDWSGTNAALTSAGALSLASNITLTGGGDIVTTANGNIDLIPNGTGITSIGGGTGSHSLNSPNDLMVNGELEVDSVAYFDSSMTVASQINLAAGQKISSGGTGSVYYPVLTGGNNYGAFGLGTGSATMIFALQGQENTAWGHPAESVPTLRMQANSSNPTHWLKIQHDDTDGVIDCGAGTLNLGATGNVNFAGATRTASTVSHDAYVTLEIAGTAYKFMLGS